MTGYQSKKAAAQDKYRAVKTYHEGKPVYVAQPAREPVAWLEPEWGEKICPEVGYEVTMTDDHPKDLGWIPLVAKRPWVGLTPEEILDLFDATNVYGSKWVEFARALEAKLKEKNT